MDICEGQITSVRESVSVHDGTSKQVYHFRIYEQQVRYSPLDSTALSEGDMVIVAGEIKNGTLEAYALRNETVGVLSEHKIHTYYIGFVVCMSAAVFIISIFSNPFFGVFPYIIATVLMSVGFVALYYGNRRRRAVELLRNF